MSNITPKLMAALVAASVLFVGSDAFAYKFLNARQCPNGASWSEANQPLSYWINEDGTPDIPLAQVESLVEDSFATWGQPCCSTFAADYQGTTSLTARQNQGKVVLSWEDNSWPSQLGSVNVTIGVTLTQVYQTCEIASAPIVFNGVGFQFCTSGNRCTDMQSIATHEIGHNLGLDHSEHRDATMFAGYSGGSALRELSQDDISGACALYPGSCSCSSDADCGPGQICTDSQCEQAPCETNQDCANSLVCNTQTGDCEVPTCQNDADCQNGFVCDQNDHCVSECPVCRSCSSQADCGGDGACASLPGGNKCVTSCGPNGGCPGDARCFQVPSPATSGSCSQPGDCAAGDQCFPTQNGSICATPCQSNQDCGSNQTCQNYGQVSICADTQQLCLNPNAPTAGACPSNYTCGADNGGGNDGGGTGNCSGLGNACSTNDFSQCTSDNDACLTLQSGDSICTCSCTSDSDCGSSGSCIAVQGGSACVPNTNGGGPCDNANCSDGQVCENGQCVDDESNPDGSDPDGSDPDGSDPDTGVGANDSVQLDSTASDSDCSTAGNHADRSTGLAWLALVGIGVVWRRRRRR